MANMQVSALIDEAISKLMVELRRERMLSGGNVVGGMSAFKKTEQLLYAYPKFGEIIKMKREKRQELVEYGVRGKSKSIVVWNPKTNVHQTDNVLESDAVQEAVDTLERDIKRLEYSIAEVDNALEKVENDPYYDVIRLKYFEGMVNEAIADELNKDASTITRNKNRLVSSLSTYLFPTDKLDEIMLS